MILSASVKRCFVSCMRDFFYCFLLFRPFLSVSSCFFLFFLFLCVSSCFLSVSSCFFMFLSVSSFFFLFFSVSTNFFRFLVDTEIFQFFCFFPFLLVSCCFPCFFQFFSSNLTQRVWHWLPWPCFEGMFTPLRMSHVTCHVSHVRCQTLGVRCQIIFILCYIFFYGQSGVASRLRVCYQGGLPRLFNRLDVARAVLQSTLFLIHWLIH